jgi:predicted AAA+ superfamily ATPase
MSPFEAGKRIKYARFGQSNYSSREISESLRTLERAMIIQLVHPSTSLSVPIIPDFKKSPKLQFLDTGLINYFAGLQQFFFSIEDLQDIYRGILAEHIVMQEILALEGNSLKKTCFWVREKGTSNAEVDLIMQHNGMLIPVEVKSGSAGRLRSLHSFIDLSKNTFAVRISSAPFSIDQMTTAAGKKYRLMSVPFYQCSKLRLLFEKYI